MTLTNLLVSDAFRLSRDPACWAALACLVSLAVCAEAGFDLVGFSSLVPLGREPAALSAVMGRGLVASGVLPLASALLGVRLAVGGGRGSFDSGLLACCGRRGLCLERLVLSALLTVPLVAAAMVGALLGARASERHLIAEPPSDLAAWLAIAWLHLVVYAWMALAVGSRIRSRTSTTALAVVLGSGLFGAVVWAFLIGMRPFLGLLAPLATWVPYAAGQVLGFGSAAFESVDVALGSGETARLALTMIDALRSAGISPATCAVVADTLFAAASAVLLLVPHGEG